MPLRIKEIYRTDLDPNSTAWWSKDKIDKLNYNFSLLSSGGTPGPAGEMGADGNSGVAGDIGPQGHVGPIGAQGLEGTEGASPWTDGRDENFITLFTKFQGPIEYMPMRVELGKLNSEQAGVIERQGHVHLLHNHDTNISNMIINSEGSQDFHFRLSPEGSAKKIEIGKLDSSPDNLTLQYDLSGMEYLLHSIRVDDNYLLEASSNQITFRSTDSVLGQNVQVTNTGTFKYNLNAIEDRLLVSLDADGNSVWKNKSDVFGSLPVGSIISIPEEFFNNTNFYLEYSETQSSASELEVIYGRGRENMSFKGWYLCNGQTWNDGVIQYEVPNLNQFDFSISSNGGDQEEIIGGGDNSQILIGGANLRMQSIYQGSNQYFSELVDDLQPSEDEITLSVSLGDFYSSRNVHIVYLKEPNYKWTSGEITPITTSDIELSEVKQIASEACLAAQITYKWTGGSTDWVAGNMVGISLYNFNLTVAPSGWYEREGLSRYWNGTSFTSSSPCLLLISVNLQTEMDVTGLNGTLSGGISYSIDGVNFKDSTALFVLGGGDYAPIGWYRETGNLNGWRRFWNGTQFVGESFNQPYIFSAGILGASKIFDSGACEITTPHPIYYATNHSTPVGLTELHKINYTEGVVLVHLNWDGVQANGSKPLVRIYNQNAPSSGSPYLSLVDSNVDSTYRANITTVSQLNTPVICSNYTINGVNIVNDNNGTVISDGRKQVTGNIVVTGAPVTLTFSTFGGVNFACFTNSEFIVNGIQYTQSATGPQTTFSEILISQNGTYAYVLRAELGCTGFGNYARID